MQFSNPSNDNELQFSIGDIDYVFDLWPQRAQIFDHQLRLFYLVLLDGTNSKVRYLKKVILFTILMKSIRRLERFWKFHIKIK